MILVRDRRAEQRKNAITGRLYDIAVVAMDRIHHELEGGIDNDASLLGIEILHHLGGTLDIGEQRGNGLTLAVAFGSFIRVQPGERSFRRLGFDVGDAERGGALATEPEPGRILKLTVGTD